jgi:hypothetical protein
LSALRPLNFCQVNPDKSEIKMVVQGKAKADPPLLKRSPFKASPGLVAKLLRQRAEMLRAGLRQRLMLRMADRGEFMQRSWDKRAE